MHEELAARTRRSLNSDPASIYSRGASIIDNAFSKFDLDRLRVEDCRAAEYF